MSEWFNRDQVEAMEESERARESGKADPAVVAPVDDATGRPRASNSSSCMSCAALEAENARLRARVQALEDVMAESSPGRRIRELHDYDVPEFLALDVAAGSKAYLDWLIRGLGPSDAAGTAQ